MGRHTSPEQWPFYRSAAAWFLPWVLIAGVVGVAVWVAVSTVGGGDGASPALTKARSSSPKAHPVSPTPEAPQTKPPKTKPPKPEPSKTESAPPGLITKGISVQVLNASGNPDADRAMSDRLEGLGFEIAAVVEASKPYDQTTVFWSSEDSRAAAEALAARFGWIVEPKPHNLSPDVSVHVVVGADEADG
jgi:hypothetical protein